MAYPTASAGTMPKQSTTLQLHLAVAALKRKPLARGKRAPREPSNVGWFSRLPWLASVAGSVALAVCHLALVAAVAPLEVIRGGAQNGSTRATTQGGS
nr:hypothetical protein [Ktedonobacteraceae bacterium]